MRKATSRRRLALILVVLGLATLAICLGRDNSQATAQPAGQKTQTPQTKPVPSAEPSLDYSKRVVAYIFENIPITREDLGEYLIARQGADRLQNLVNKRIIDHVCRQKGIEVTSAEVEAGLEEDLRGINVNRKEFVDRVLKQYHKTLYEWKEDVIKPRILMSKLCRERVQVKEEEVKMAYEAYYGEKIDCRIILWPKGSDNIAMKMYEKIRSSEEEFDRAARSQASATLASTGGRIKPIGRNTAGNPELEKAAFSLQPGELSQIISTPEGPVVVKCVARIPPDKSKTIDEVRSTLEREVFEKKVQLEIPVVFNEMRELAKAKVFLKSYTTEEELVQDVRDELSRPDPLSTPSKKK